MIVTGPREVIAAWVGAQVGLEFKAPYSVLASIGADGRITAGVVFQNWTGRDIELSVAASSISRSFLKAISTSTRSINFAVAGSRFGFARAI